METSAELRMDEEQLWLPMNYEQPDRRLDYEIIQEDEGWRC